VTGQSDQTNLAAHQEPFLLDVEGMPPGSLRVLELHVRDAINEVGGFQVLAALPSGDPDVLADGLPVTVTFPGEEGHRQVLHGVIVGVDMAPARIVTHGSSAVFCFRVHAAPRLALADMRTTSRRFQEMTAQAIVAEVLAAHRVRMRWEVVRELPVLDYVAQSRESDLAFVQRILAREGIMFWFEHAPDGIRGGESREVMVLTDEPTRARPIAGGALRVRESSAAGALRVEEDHVQSFLFQRRVRSDQVLVRDYDFTHPSREERGVSGPVRGGERDLGGRLPARWGVYQPEMGTRDPHLADTDAVRRLEQERATANVYVGETPCPRVRAGQQLTLTEHPVSQLDGLYHITWVEHRGVAPEHADGRPVYQASFGCVRAGVPFRPRLLPPPARGTETAVVVGPPGEEIHVDAYGRVKVQFHWDLDGQGDGRSSAWIRVATPWQGARFGVSLPLRVGMEVIVTYLDGDPSRPLITGCVPNALQPPAFMLPVERTRTGIKTRSSPGGEGYNELSFDDKKGLEQVRLHAERNLDETVKQDHTSHIGRHQSLTVGGDQTTRVAGTQSVATSGARAVHVEGPLTVKTDQGRVDAIGGDHAIRVDGNQHHVVAGVQSSMVEGDATHTYRAARFETIEGPSSTQIGTPELPQPGELYAHDRMTLASGKTLYLQAAERIVLQCGETTLELTPEGAILRGGDIRIIGSEQASMEHEGGPLVLAKDQLDISAKEVHIFGETSRLSLTKTAELKAPSTLVTGGGAGLGLAGSATLAGGKVVVAGKGATLVLDDEAKLDGAFVKLNCGGAGGGVAATDRDPRKLVTPQDRRRKGFQLRVLDHQEQPLALKRFDLTVEGELFEGRTDDSGQLLAEDGSTELQVAEEAQLGRLRIWEDEGPTGAKLTWGVHIAPLPEPNTVPGARIRLTNMAYYLGPPVDEMTDRLRAAVAAFQRDRHVVPVTGELDGETVLALIEAYGH